MTRIQVILDQAQMESEDIRRNGGESAARRLSHHFINVAPGPNQLFSRDLNSEAAARDPTSEKFSSLNLNARFLKLSETHESTRGKHTRAIRCALCGVFVVTRDAGGRPANVLAHACALPPPRWQRAAVRDNTPVAPPPPPPQSRIVRREHLCESLAKHI